MENNERRRNIMETKDNLITMTAEELRLVKEKDSYETVALLGVITGIWYALCAKKVGRKLKKLQG